MKAAALRAALAEAEAQLDGHPDVTAVGIGEKFRDGEPAGSYAVVVHVEAKGTPRGPLIDRTLVLNGEHIPTDIVEAPEESLVLSNSAVDGSDLLIAGEVGRVGTLGLVVREQGGLNRTLALTNAHVVTVPDGDAIGAPIHAEPQGIREEIGIVLHHAPYRSSGVNTVDLAVIQLNSRGVALAEEYRIQTFPNAAVIESDPLSFSRFGGALRPHAYGGSTLFSRDVVPISQPVEHRRLRLRDTTGVTMTFGRSFLLRAGGVGVLGGHSGSLIVREKRQQGLVATGLLAGGRGTVAAAFSFTDVLAECRRAGIAVA